MRSVFVGCCGLIIAAVAGCKFETTPLAKSSGASASKIRRVDAGHVPTSKIDAGGKSEHDAGSVATGNPDASLMTVRDASLLPEAAMPPGREEAGVIGADAFGSNPTPTDPGMKPMTGGLK